jgi:hypothetical protein
MAVNEQVGGSSPTPGGGSAGEGARAPSINGRVQSVSLGDEAICDMAFETSCLLGTRAPSPALPPSMVGLLPRDLRMLKYSPCKPKDFHSFSVSPY